MGIEGPTTLGYLRTLIFALLVGGACVGASRVVLDVIKMMARCAHPALASARRGRAVHRHRDRRRHADHADQRRAVPRFPGRRQPGVPAAELRPPGPGSSSRSHPERSGSPMSFAPWDTLGYQGRNFVATGPDVDELARVNGSPPRSPSGSTPDCRPPTPTTPGWTSCVRELERTGAFDRKLLVIIPTTGTGWVNPVAARRHRDDVQRRHRAGRHAVFVSAQLDLVPRRPAEVDRVRPVADRRDPRPMAAAAAGPATQSWCSTARASARWRARARSAGCPTSRGWASPRCCGWGRPTRARCGAALVQRRDPGTPEVEPRYDNGRTVRFCQATDAADIARTREPPWEGTRVLFLQHASDPIVWWSPYLLFSRPDWLVEPPGAGPHGIDALVPDHHVLAGGCRHDERRGCQAAMGTTTALGARRLGGRGAARWLDG